MSSPEVERFEITEDDLADELNPNRRKFKMSKNQTLYGIWADDEENDERPRFGGKRGKQDYAAPVNFVSGGVKIGDKVTKQGEDDDEITDSDDEDDKVRAAAAQAARSHGKRGTVSAFKSTKGDFGDWERHTKGIGQKLLEKMGHVAGKGLGKNLQGISKPVEASKRRGRGAIGLYGTEKTEQAEQDFPTKPDSDEEQEREFRVKLQQWKKGEGERKKKIKYVTADELIASGGAVATTFKRKVSATQSELSKVKVIDMTGREQRVMSGYHALSLRHDRPGDDDSSRLAAGQGKRQFELPELLHNLDLLVGMAEDEILQNERKLNYELNLRVNLDSEHERVSAVCEGEERQMERLKEILAIVGECETRCKAGAGKGGGGGGEEQSLERCAELFGRLQDEFYEEYRVYELSSLAVAMVHPLLKGEFEGWDPLRRPHQCTATIARWKTLLQGMSQPYAQGPTALDAAMEPYDRLIWQVVMPCLRAAVLRKWAVREPNALLEVIEAWLHLLPEWITRNLLEQCVYPRLAAEVESWNPLADTVPIHAWLHPWLPIMAERLEPLYAPIRQKLASALTNWHPSDPSAKLILQPWVGVFRPGHMDAFLVRSIVPKLALCLQEFIINPQQQSLDAWNWVTAWLDVVPHVHMVALLEKTFFPRWLGTLSAWLASAPNYDEVTKWYVGWKSMFAESLLADLAVKDALSRALELMNRAVVAHHQPGARENIAYLTSTERRRDFELPPSAATAVPADRKDHLSSDMARGLTASSAVPTNFKDLVERRAEENNIVYAPMPGKTHEGKNVYRFGRLQMYIDRGIIFALDNGKWDPISLNTLIDRAT